MVFGLDQVYQARMPVGIVEAPVFVVPTSPPEEDSSLLKFNLSVIALTRLEDTDLA